MFRQQISWSPVARWSLLALLTVSGLAQVVGFALAWRQGGWVALPVVVPIVLLVGFLLWQFGTLRLELDERLLTLGFGIIRRREPLTRILSWKPVTYSAWHWGGWGIRLRFRQTLYNVPGDGGRAVELSLEGGKKLLFSSPDPEAVCAALATAKGL